MVKVSLLTENGGTRDNLRLPTDENMLTQIKDGFVEGKDTVVFLFILLKTVMGSVCSAGKAEKNKNNNKEVRGKGLGNLKKLKSVAKGKGDCYSNPKISDRGRNKNGSEFRISNPTGKEGTQGSQRGSIWGIAGERAVEFLDTLGSSVPKLSNSNGFGTAVAPRGNRISILAFEVAPTVMFELGVYKSIQ